MRRRFICIGCSGGCELITDSFNDYSFSGLPKNCKNSDCCNWKELLAEGKECCHCGSTETCTNVLFECDTCKAFTEPDKKI